MKFNALALIASFAVGMLYMICTVPKPRVVIKFPTPDRAGLDMYQTRDGQCYKVDVETVTCPADGKNVRSQPVVDHQEVDDDESWLRSFS